MITQPPKGIFFRDFTKDHIAEVIKEAWLEDFYRPLLHKGDIILECGANLGLWTMFAYEYASKIYSVEPSKPHLEILNYMLDFNNMRDKVTVVPVALSNKDGEMTFYHNENSTMNSLSPLTGQPELGTEVVRTVTLKTLFKENNIDHVDVFNLDVEGAEFDILSSDEFTEVAPLIKTLVVEYHTWTGISFVQLITMLEDRGFTVEQARTQAMVFIAKHE